MSFGQGVIAAGDQRALAQRQRGVEWSKKFKKACREIANRIEVRRRGISLDDAIGEGQWSEGRIRLDGRGGHG